MPERGIRRKRRKRLLLEVQPTSAEFQPTNRKSPPPSETSQSIAARGQEIRVSLRRTVNIRSGFAKHSFEGGAFRRPKSHEVLARYSANEVATGLRACGIVRAIVRAPSRPALPSECDIRHLLALRSRQARRPAATSWNQILNSEPLSLRRKISKILRQPVSDFLEQLTFRIQDIDLTSLAGNRDLQVSF